MESKTRFLTIFIITCISLVALLWVTFYGATASPLHNPYPLGKGSPLLWSPDSSMLLISRLGRSVWNGRSGQVLQELWAFYPDTGELKKLADNAFFPTFSPDGKELAFVSFAGPGEGRLEIMDLKTGQSRPVGETRWGAKVFWTAKGLLYQEGRYIMGHQPTGPRALASLGEAYLISISPDGNWALARRGNSVILKNLKSGAEYVLFQARYVGSVAWSPDDQSAAVIASPEPGIGQLWVVETTARKARLLWEAQSELPNGPTWAPGGDFIAFARYPLGAGTAEAADIWIADLGSGKVRKFIATPGEDGSPLWSPDGRFVAFKHGDEVWLAEVEGFKVEGGTIEAESKPVTGVLHLPTAVFPMQVTTPLSAPKTIRVMHDPNNYYRSDVPPYHVDEIDFETYVKQVVPYEMPASWYLSAPEALKAQAVAARTYGWYFVLHPAGKEKNYHITDWVAHQVMGPDTHPYTNEAVDLTQGQYIAYKGDVILAEYSAENSSPTLPRYITDSYKPDPEYPYLSPVYDPVGFGQPRRGHGRGMSQWGAKRWAEWYGWNYQQILAHYYTGIIIQKALTEEIEPPLTSIVFPWSGFYMNSARALLMANASDEASGVLEVDFMATYGEGTIKPSHFLGSDTNGLDGWSLVWDLSSVSDQSVEDGIELRSIAYDGAKNPQYGGGTAIVGLDRSNPDGIAYSKKTVTSTLDVTLTLLATDNISGEIRVSASNDWLWEGEELFREVVNGITVGHPISDPDALNGSAMYAEAGVDPAGAWYGPYTFELEPGRAYRAIFRLKTDNVTTAEEIALLDVVQNAGTELLGIRRIRGIDFREPLTYQEFPVDFYYWEEGRAGLEFRLTFRGVADIYLDRILVTSYPSPFENSFRWRLAPGEGQKLVWVKFFDEADNVSSDVTLTFTITDVNPPGNWGNFSPSGWAGQTTTVTCTVQVADDVSGISPNSALFRYSIDGGNTWSNWLSATMSLSNVLEGLVIASAGPFTEGLSNRIQFQVADNKGFVSTSPVYTVALDIVPPTAHITSPETSLLNAFTVTWMGSDNLSGIAGYDVQYCRDGGDWTSWLTATSKTKALFTGEFGHRYAFRVRAWDKAGNVGPFSPEGEAVTLVYSRVFLPIILR